MIDFPLKNWIPVKLVDKADGLQCRWIDTFEKPFVEPFFDETILKCITMAGRNAAHQSLSDLPIFEEWTQSITGLVPSAIIFHISRCGSTLVSQLLSTSAENIVLAEVPFFDDLLRLPYRYDFSASEALDLFASAVKFYGQQRAGTEEHLYIKTDSWHIFFYDQLRQLYPTVPFVLMYRKPNEVFNSNKKKAGMQSVPGIIEPAVLGFMEGEEVPYDADKYLSIVLERYLNKYLEISDNDERALLVNYNEGAMAIIKKIADFTGNSIDNGLLAVMEERSRYHSKKPDQFFSETNTVEIPQYLDKAMEAYYRLEERRINN